MAGIDDVLERLVTDPAFRTALEEDAGSALAGYTLSKDDLRLLSSTITDSAGDAGTVEQRTSKAGLFGGVLSGFESAGELTELEDTSLTYQRIKLEQVDFGPGDPNPGADVAVEKLTLAHEHIDLQQADDTLPEEVGFAYKTISFDDPRPAGDLAAGDDGPSETKIDGYLKVPDIPGNDGPGDDLASDRGGTDPKADEYGRVKPQFHWDQEDKSAATSPDSSGVHDGTYMVSSATHQSLDDGDPDSPYVLGRVYNEASEHEEELEGFGDEFDPGRDRVGATELQANAETNPQSSESDLDFAQQLAQHQPSASDDGHEIEMDVHVGTAPPEDPDDLASASHPTDTGDGVPARPEIDDETLVGLEASGAGPMQTSDAGGTQAEDDWESPSA